MSMWYLGMNTPSVFHGGHVLATEIDAPLSGIRWQLGARLVPRPQGQGEQSLHAT